jgi:pimeloyl-ACP methyl ester carboxylesterase
MRFLYLHGFASGPQSRKAREFQGALAASPGFPALEIPQLDEGNFEGLTISGQLDVMERTLRGEAACLIGSSLGGYLAALYASRHPEINRLVLLAPAFGFSSRWNELTGTEKMLSWRETGWLEVFHYAAGVPRRVHYGLYEDANRFPPEPDFTQPALIFHGLGDDVVPVECSRRFVASHANVKLLEVDSDHELTNVLGEITATSVPFLRLGLNPA